MKNGKEYVIKFSKQAEKDKIKLKSSGLDKNCINILVLMKNDPFCYPLSYEKLSGDLSGLYSRRINRQHRIVYEVNEEDKEIHILRIFVIILVRKYFTVNIISYNYLLIDYDNRL